MSTVIINESVRSVRGQDGALLLDLERGVYLSLNKLGSEIWAQLQDGVRLPELVAALSGRFEVAPARLREDVEKFLRQLAERGLVSLDGRPQP